MKVTHDLAVKTGTYTDSEGNEKGRYENVGKVFEDDNGGRFITMKRTFNPAGVPVAPGKDSIILSIFPAKERGSAQGQQQRPQQQRPQQERTSQQPKQQQQAGDPFGDMGDDIPF